MHSATIKISALWWQSASHRALWDRYSFQISIRWSNSKRSALFWDITQCRVVIGYRRCGKTYRSHFQGSRSPTRNKDNEIKDSFVDTQLVPPLWKIRRTWSSEVGDPFNLKQPHTAFITLQNVKLNKGFLTKPRLSSSATSFDLVKVVFTFSTFKTLPVMQKRSKVSFAMNTKILQGVTWTES